MSVTTIHPEYRAVLDRWALIRAIVNNYAKEFLRTPDINDVVRSSQYKNDGLLTNFTNLTRVGLTGLVFRKAPKIQLPPELDYLMDNLTGTGINIYQFSQHSISELLQMGRHGLLVDKSDGGKTYIKPYVAENIINWKTVDIDGECVLSLVVLREWKQSDDNIFSQDTIRQYRVLFLDENGNYRQSVYSYYNDYALNDGYQVTEEYLPLDANGKPFNRIQFVFAGSENNDWNIDPQPLYDLAQVNLAHYKCSCDQMEAVWLCGQPYLVMNVGDSSLEEFTAANPNGVVFGSRKGLVLSNGGNAQLLQANPNQMVGEVMKELLNQAAAIGARLIAPAGGRETAEAAKIRYGSQHSSLYTLTSNYSWAMVEALKMACASENANPDEVMLELNDEFYDEIADPQLVAQQIMLLDRGIISPEEIRDYGRRTGFINDSKTDEEIQAAVDMSFNPLMGAMNANVPIGDTQASAAPYANSADTSPIN